jgi:NADPH:quinone reductase-like Zn-dependent oxidoreductase
MAGEVVSIGTKVTQWKVGDRVCSNVCLDHLDGEPRPDTSSSALGGPIHGVLTQFRALPEMVGEIALRKRRTG